MKGFFVFFFFLFSVSSSSVYRRVLHQPLFPEDSTPPPPDLQSTPPPPATPDQPFFPENPSTPEQTQTQYPPPPSPPAVNGGLPIPTSTTQPSKPGKKVAIVISVGIVTLGMLSGLAFFLYRHKVKHASDTQKLVHGDGNDSRRIQEDPRPPTTTTSSTFLYMGTVEPSRESVSDLNAGGGSSVPVNTSPYRKLNSVNGKRSDRYRPSPELQPLPPLSKPQQSDISPSSSSSTPSDEESEYRNASFYTPHGSASDDGYYTPFPRSGNSNGGSNPHSKRTSPRSKFGSTAASRSPEMKHVIIPSIKQKPPTKSPSPVRSPHVKNDEQEVPYSQNKPKFSQPPPPPNRAAFQAITQTPPPRRSPPPHPRQTPPPPPPPPPPLPPPPPQKRPRSFEIPRKLSNSEATNLVTSDILSSKEVVNTPILKTKSLGEVNGDSAGSLEKSGDGDTDPSRPKLKPLHWDKVRAHSDRATVWDQLKSSSFQYVPLPCTWFCYMFLSLTFLVTF